MKTKGTLTRLLIVIAALMLLPTAQAQQDRDDEKTDQKRKEMSEKFRAAKIAFITDQLSLSPAEAEKFWPVYNEMEQKREEITRGLIERFRDRENEKPEISEEEAEKIMQKRFDEEQQLLDLKREYHKKLTTILPATRVLRLYEAENMFRRHLMEKLGHREGPGRPEEGGRGAPNRHGFPIK